VLEQAVEGDGQIEHRTSKVISNYPADGEPPQLQRRLGLLLSNALNMSSMVGLGPKLDIAAIPFVPDLVQLDYQLRPQLRIVCGECGVNKLPKLPVKASEAEIWIVKRSLPAAKHLLEAMEKVVLRQGRYRIIALDQAMVEEMAACWHLETSCFG
jgi:hypothetical protein